VSDWLADPGVEWISVFEDDVDVRPEALEVLARVQEPTERPILTGFYVSEHRPVGAAVISGRLAVFQRSARGTHLDAHRDYWEAVLPAPTP